MTKNGTRFVQCKINTIYLPFFFANTLYARLSSTSTSCSFSDLVTSEEGAILSRELVLATIKASTLGNSSNQYIYISSFLDSNCSHLLGDNNIIYYKVKKKKATVFH